MVLIMKWGAQHISALILLAFVAMVTDLAGLYEAIADDDTSVSVMTGCHSSEIPADWKHDEPCDPDNVLPCHICAILDLELFGAPAAEHETIDPAVPVALEDAITATDPDPPKSLLL